MNYQLYEKAFSLKGLRKPITIEQAHSDRDAKFIVKRLFPGLSHEWHARLAIAASDEVNRLQSSWKKTADAAMFKIAGRNFLVSDYRVSAVGCDEFSEPEKNALREICRKTNIANAASRAHVLAATLHCYRAMKKRYAEGLA